MPILDTFTIRRGDTLPSLRRTLGFDDGSAQDLSAATQILFLYAPNDGGEPSEQGMIVGGPVVIENALLGIVRLDWRLIDTRDAGEFLAEFEVSFASGLKLTFPNGEKEYIRVLITDDVERSTYSFLLADSSLVTDSVTVALL